MILLIDVGNTNVTIGVCNAESITASWRMATNRALTSDEIGINLLRFFEAGGIERREITAAAISSVVPPVMYSLTHAVRKYIGVEPVIVSAGSKLGITIKYDNPAEVGADRLVNAAGAAVKYKLPLIIIDFGTATTFCALNEKKEYLGGAILPGIKISLEALVEKTSKLPKIEIARPAHIIGKNTVESMQAGMYYGYAGCVDTIVRKMKAELGENASVIATGGLARMIAEESETIDKIDSNLTLEGLKIIYENETKGAEKE